MRKISMSKIKEVLRLKYLNKLSNRQIQSITGISRNSVANYGHAYKALGSTITEVLALSDDVLQDLFHSKKIKSSSVRSTLNHPDWIKVNEALKEKGMTRLLLWEEYKQADKSLYSYSQFNRYYKRYIQTINPSMRQIHYSGDKLFIDYSGLTMPITDQLTGEVNKAQIFVSVLGASGYTFVHASTSQSTEDFIGSHVEAFLFYGGVPNILVPDNLKAAVISHKKGIVKLNESYADMGRHYNIAIEPARPYKPQDKSKVELGVKAIQRWILMRLRHHTFFSINELNNEIGLLLDIYNNRIIRRLGKSRVTLFNELDKPQLRCLPTNRYIYKQFKLATVGVDYHVELEGSGYSVPYQYLGKKVEIIYSSNSVIINSAGQTLAHHPRQTQAYHDSTLLEHMPSEHQYQYEKWNPKRILTWANNMGVNTTALMESIIQKRSHPTRGYKSCMAILNFSKIYGVEALELVSQHALEHKICKVSAIESILKTKSYLLHTSLESANNIVNNKHENIRGSAYYSACEAQL